MDGETNLVGIHGTQSSSRGFYTAIGSSSDALELERNMKTGLNSEVEVLVV